MTVDEIFSKLSSHMVEGLMIHAQMSDYYGFLNLKGYQMCHKYHFLNETLSYRRISEYYLAHYNKIITEIPVDNPQIIPESWYKYNKYNVTAANRKAAIQTGMDKWVQWEKDTKKMYEQMYHELTELGEIAAAMKLGDCIKGVSKELSKAEEKNLRLKSIDYDMSIIVDNQEEMYEKYKNKICEINLV